LFQLNREAFEQGTRHPLPGEQPVYRFSAFGGVFCLSTVIGVLAGLLTGYFEAGCQLLALLASLFC
jgi:hypothetical protein